jgi:hypothetical protein
MHCLDQPLHTAAIAKGLTSDPNTVDQGIVADKLVGPQLLKQLVLCHGAATLSHKVGQQGKGLWFDLERFASVAELISICVKFILSKDIYHT